MVANTKYCFKMETLIPKLKIVEFINTNKII